MSAIDQAGGLDLYAAFAKSGELLFSFTKAGVTVAKVDNAAVAEFKAATGVTPGGLYIRAQSALDGNLPGAPIDFTAGSAHGSGAAGSVIVTPGSTATGAAGAFIVRQPGGSAGTDELWLSHSGSYSYIDGKDTAVIARGNGTNCWMWTANKVNLFDGKTATFGADDDWDILYDETTTDSLVFRELGVGALVFKGSAISGFAGAADVSGNDVFAATQDGGAHTTNNPRGGNLTLTMGAPAATGTGVHGYFSIAVGALGNVVSFGGTNTARALGFFGVTPVIRATALTAASALSVLGATNIAPWGYASEADANSIVSVLLNVVTRLNEAEARLKLYGLFI